MSTSHPLDAFTGPIKSSVGGVIGGERTVFRGHDLHQGLRDIHWVELLLLGVTGRRFTPGEVRVCNAVMTFTSYPDARIWNNRVAALAGSVRSTGNLGVSAALSISEAKLFGGQICYEALEVLYRARAYVDQGGDLATFTVDHLARYRRFAGFGRPLTAQDERIAPMLALLKEEGLEDGPFVRTVKAVEAILKGGRWRYRMNFAALAAAIYGDLGFTPKEFYLAIYPAFLCGMIPCYLEGQTKPAGGIMALSCDAVTYKGPPPRRWAQ